MSSSLPGARPLPSSQYDLSSYWGRVQQAAEITDPRTLFVSSAGLEHAKRTVTLFREGKVQDMTPELWKAKKIVDSTLHPDTGEPVFLPFRMSCFVLSNLIVTAGMLTPGLKTKGILAWQITNQSLNVAINSSNANKSTPLPLFKLAQSYLFAVSASCTVALSLNALVPRLRFLSGPAKVMVERLVPFAAVASAGALNVVLMRGEEIRRGIDVFPASRACTKIDADAAKEQGHETIGSKEDEGTSESLGKSRQAAKLAVGETAISRVLNATPIMVIPPLVLVRLQRTGLLKRRPRLALPMNLGLILTTSIFALPLALAAFPQRQTVDARSLEQEFWNKVPKDGRLEFNRGI